MSKRYGDRGFGRYGDSDEDRTEDRDYVERDTNRAYGDAGERPGRGADYGTARRGGYTAARGGDYDYGRDYGYGREYGSRYGSRDYGTGEYPSRYGREGLAGGYAGSPPRRYEGEDYGRDHAARAHGRDAGRDYVRSRSRSAPDDEGVREYDTDYGRTTSRFYGRSGYEYGRDDYERDEARSERGRRPAAERGEGRGWLDRAADEVRAWFGGDDDDSDDRRRELRAGRGEGRFRGRGPRNYRRSDERVREEVCERLTDSEWLDASDIEVGVAAGEIILTGTVDSRYAKRLAESIAESVSGVNNVQNNLRIHQYQPLEPGAATETTVVTPPAPAPDATAATGAPDPFGTDPGGPETPPNARPSTKAAGRS